MKKYKSLGIDTSNYTTSAACVCDEYYQVGKLLPVGLCECGIRQSNALFEHTKAIGDVIGELSALINLNDIDIIGVSDRPRDIKGSYMPCFLSGVAVAKSIGAVYGVPVKTYSHQAGHIAAALFSCGKLYEFVRDQTTFLALHISGGTTELLKCCYNLQSKTFDIEIIGETLDLNAGQVIDRVGVMNGLSFPCGRELDRLSMLATAKVHTAKICVHNGNCNLSGVENIAKTLQDKGEHIEEIAYLTFDFISKTLIKMIEDAKLKTGEIPIVAAGGVMSNTIIRERLAEKFNPHFAAVNLSRDNAVGIAVLAQLEKGEFNLGG